MTFLRYRIITLLAVATGANNCPNDHGLLASPTTVPFELRNDVPLVHARVNGVEFLLVLDSGSGSLVLDYAATREAHVHASSFGITNSRRPVGRVADSINLGAAVVHDAPIAVANMAAIQRHFGFDVRGASDTICSSDMSSPWIIRRRPSQYRNRTAIILTQAWRPCPSDWFMASRW